MAPLYTRFTFINKIRSLTPILEFFRILLIMDLKHFSILLARHTTLPERAIFLLKRDPSLLSYLQVDPGLPYATFAGDEYELAFQQLIARSSINQLQLKTLKSFDDPRISQYFLLNKNVNFESKIKLINEPIGSYFSTTTIFFFIQQYFSKLDENQLNTLSILLNNVSHADDFILNYKFVLQAHSTEDVSPFFFTLDYLTPRVHERALRELVRATATQGFTMEREYFLSLYRGLGYKKNFTVEHASPTLSSLLPATFLPLESYQHLSLNESKKETPLAIYDFFVQFLESTTVSPVELYEVLQLATFWEGSFKELLELRALL
jgi:hypothetical protein